MCTKISKGKDVVRLGDLNHEFIYRPFGFTDWNDRLSTLKNSYEKESLKFISTPNIFKYHVDWNKKITVNKQSFHRKYIPYFRKYQSSWAKLCQENILIKEVALNLTAAYSMGEYGHLTGVYGLIIKNDLENKYILSLLNSKLMNFYYKSYYGIVHLSGGYLKINSSYLENMPIKIPTNEIQKSMVRLVERILEITKDENYLENGREKSEVAKLEKEIDTLVYKLYDLTQTEIAAVEDFSEKNG
jgi:restriction endonuclease S subunit